MIGIDILEVDRVDMSENFMHKIAHDDEIDYIKKSPCQSLQKQRLASLFCVKEAVMKALNMGKNSGVSFKDIKLCHEEGGMPFVQLLGRAKEKFDTFFKDKKIHVSISHTQNYASAVALIN